MHAMHERTRRYDFNINKCLAKFESLEGVILIINKKFGGGKLWYINKINQPFL